MCIAIGFLTLRISLFLCLFVWREGSPSKVMSDKMRASLSSSWKLFQRQSPSSDSSTPWCRLLTQSSIVSHVS